MKLAMKAQGLSPVVPKEPTFLKKNGMIGKPNISSKRFYTTPEEYGDVFRAVALRKHTAHERKDSASYQSWLHSHANFNDGGAPPRIYRLKSSLAGKKLIVNPIVACFLLSGDTWGDHQNTAAEYRRRNFNSMEQRKKKQQETNVLKAIKRNTYPPDWDSKKMSNFKAVEGYDNRGRAPTVVQLLSKCVYMGMLHRQTISKRVVGSVSKPSTVAANDEKVSPRIPLSERLTRYPVKISALSTLVKYEKRIARGQSRGFKKHILERQEYTNRTAHENEEFCIYQSTLAVPELMSNIRYPNASRFVIPTIRQVADFEKENYFDPWENYWTNDASDDIRYDCWLSSRYVHNSRRIPNVPHILKDMSPYERRLQFFDYQRARGKISIKAHRLVRAQIIHLNKIATSRFQLIGEPVGISRKPISIKKFVNHKLKGLPSPEKVIPLSEMRLKSIEASVPEWCHNQIGLDIQMTSMEYKNLERTAPTSVDKHLMSTGLIGLRDYSATGSMIAAELERRKLNIKLGSLYAGDLFVSDKKVGIALPSYDSIESLERFVKSVSQRG